MNGTRIQIDAQNFTSKIAPALELVALCSVNWKPAQLLELLAREELLDIFVPQKHVIGVAEPTLDLTARMNVLGQNASCNSMKAPVYVSSPSVAWTVPSIPYQYHLGPSQLFHQSPNA